MMYPFITSILCLSLPAWADPEGESPTPIGVTDLTLDERLRLVPVYHQDLETFVGVIDLISLSLDSMEWVLSLDAGRSMLAQPTRIGNTVDAATDTHARVSFSSHPWASEPQIWVPRAHIDPAAQEDLDAFRDAFGGPFAMVRRPWLRDGPVAVLDGPQGAPVGTLDLKRRSVTNMEILLRPVSGTSLLLPIGGGDTMEVEYELPALLFFDRRPGPGGQPFVQILPQAVPGGVWVAEDRVGAQRWAAYLSGAGGLWDPSYGGIDVHRQADAGSRARHMPEGVYDVQALGESQGDWFKVRFIQYDGEFQCGGEGQPTGKTWEGWVPALNDEGRPAFGISSRGC